MGVDVGGIEAHQATVRGAAGSVAERPAAGTDPARDLTELAGGRTGSDRPPSASQQAAWWPAPTSNSGGSSTRQRSKA